MAGRKIDSDVSFIIELAFIDAYAWLHRRLPATVTGDKEKLFEQLWRVFRSLVKAVIQPAAVNTYVAIEAVMLYTYRDAAAFLDASTAHYDAS